MKIKESNMGLKVSDFSLDELKGVDILEMKVDITNESTVLFQNKDGKLIRRRMPAHLVHMLEWYCNAA
jgi:hypothetical protein